MSVVSTGPGDASRLFSPHRSGRTRAV